jgi:translation initiation factor 3 subunit C
VHDCDGLAGFTPLSNILQDPEGFERAYTAAIAVKEAPIVKKVKKTTTETDEPEDFTTVGKGGKAMQFTADGIFKNLQLVQEARGKKVRRCSSTAITPP